MFDPDRAIEKCVNDELDRCEFAKYLGEVILNYKEVESLVIGLLGKWGYGKTSIVNMVKEHVTELSKNEEHSPITMEFNPWNFSQQNQLILQFFNELIITLEKNHVPRAILNKLKSYVSKITISSAVLIGGVIRPSTTKIFLDHFKKDKTEDLTLEDIRKDLNNLLGKLDRKIIIYIDDIDRLNDLEIRQIFQLIKLLADFPNTIYLITFDRNVVTNALEPIQKGDGKKYLEKIVQIPFEVPKVPDEDIERLLFKQINELIFEVPDRFDEKHWADLYYGGLKYFFKNIRDAKRYSNILKFNFQLINDEVNVADLFALTCIQIFEPNIYYGIRDNEDLFVGVFNFQVSGASTIPQQEQAKNRCDEIIDFADDETLKEPLKSLLINLFPKLSALYGRTNLGSDWLGIWRKELRICSPDHFNTYFKLSISKEELTQGRIKSILELSNNIELFKESLLDLNKEGKVVRFLERLEDYTSKEIPESNIETIIQVLMDVGDLLDDGYAGLLKPDTQMRILRIIRQLLLRFNTQEERFKILERTIESTSESLYPIVHEIGVQDQEHGKYELSKEPVKPEQERTINSEQLEQLEKLVCDKINLWATENRLLKNKNLGDILFLWKTWGNKEKVDEYVMEKIEDDRDLVSFITGFTGKTSSWAGGDHFENVYYTIHLKFIEEFTDSSEIKPRIEHISESDEFNGLNEDEKRAVKLFLENIDDL